MHTYKKKKKTQIAISNPLNSSINTIKLHSKQYQYLDPILTT